MRLKRFVFVAVFAALSLAMFASNLRAAEIMPSYATLPAGWTTDRYEPVSFLNVGTFQGRANVLGISIGSATDSANRGGQSASFYNTQGRAFEFGSPQGPGSVVSSALYIPAAWANQASGAVRTDMWGVMVDGSNAITAYPIIGFTNYGGTARLRVFNVDTGLWTDLPGPVNYDAWTRLSIELTPTTLNYYVNGVLVNTQSAINGSVGFKSTIMQAYNFADPAIVPAALSTAPYTAHWSNVGQTAVVDDDLQCPSATLTTITAAINASLPGETIQVCPGTYNESPQINKSLTVQSTGGRNVTTIQLLPSGTPGTGYTGAIHIDNATADVSIDGFTIRGNDAVGAGLANSNVLVRTANSVTLTNSRIRVGAPGTGFNGDDGIGIVNYYGLPTNSITVTNTEFSPTNAEGFRAFYANAGVLNFTFQNNQVTGHFTRRNITEARTNIVTNNVVTGAGAGAFGVSGGLGVDNYLNYYPTQTSTFTGNIVSNVSAGLWIGYYSAVSNVTATGNSFINNNEGVSVFAGSTGITLNFNRIAGNALAGVRNNSGSFTAENNWWGCNYGPGAGGPGCLGTANGIIGIGAASVDANPWLVMTNVTTPTPVLVDVPTPIYWRLTTNSDGATPVGGFVRDGTPSSFTSSLAGSTVTNPTGFTTSGQTGTIFQSPNPGVSNVTSTIDGQTVGTVINVYNAACAAISIPTSIPTRRNQPVIVPINSDLLTGRNALGYVTTINYQQSRLTFNGISSAGTLTSGFTYEVDSSVPGTLRIFGFDLVNGAPLSGSGVLLNLNFTAIGTISATPTPIEFASFSFNEGNPCSTTTNGSVKIISGDISGKVTYALNGSNGVPNVAMNATGTSPAVTTNTDYTPGNPVTWGNYTLNGFGSGPYTVTPAKAPQPAQSGPTINGITPLDASCIAKWGVGQTCGTTASGTTSVPALGSARFRAADVTKNGTLSPLDAAYIAQFSVNTPNPGFAGTWEFINASTSYDQTQIENGVSAQNYTAILLGDVTGNWDPAIAGGNRPAPVDSELQKDAVTAAAADLRAVAGTSVTVPVSISNLAGRGVTAYQFDIVYDPRVLETLETAAGLAGTVSDGMSVVFNRTEAGRLRVGVYGATSVAGDGTLINLNFRAIGAVGTATSLSIDSLVLNEGGIVTLTRDGQVSIAAAEQGTIRGRLLTALGQGVVNARVTLTSTTGEKRSVLSSSFGNFEFGSLATGETYTVTVNSKRFNFGPRTVSVVDAVTILDIIAEQ